MHGHPSYLYCTENCSLYCFVHRTILYTVQYTTVYLTLPKQASTSEIYVNIFLLDSTQWVPGHPHIHILYWTLHCVLYCTMYCTVQCTVLYTLLYCTLYYTVYCTVLYTVLYCSLEAWCGGLLVSFFGICPERNEKWCIQYSEILCVQYIIQYSI